MEHWIGLRLRFQAQPILRFIRTPVDEPIVRFVDRIYLAAVSSQNLAPGSADAVRPGGIGLLDGLIWEV
ncbi:MAG: hypothetical protein AAF709_14620, partial [Pseudomonadota bacterium]